MYLKWTMCVQHDNAGRSNDVNLAMQHSLEGPVGACINHLKLSIHLSLASLQELTEYNVSVQAVNSGEPSRSLTAAVRMVTVGQLGRTETLFRMPSFAGPFHCKVLVSACIHPICVCGYSDMLLFSLLTLGGT